MCDPGTRLISYTVQSTPPAHLSEHYFLDWAFILTGAAVVIITGISKSGFAGGLSVLAVPVLSLVVSPAVAAAIMLPILIIIDISNIVKYRLHWVKRIVLLLIPGALVGILIGSATFSMINIAWLKTGVGALAIWFSYTTLATILWPEGTRASKKPAGSMAAVFFGTLAGFTSFVAHAGAPPIKGFLLSQRLDKTAFVATNAVFFFTMNTMKLPPYFMIGQFTPENLKLSLILLPFVPVGILIGYQLHRIVSQQMFVKLMCVLLAFAGVRLLWDGVSLLTA